MKPDMHWGLVTTKGRVIAMGTYIIQIKKAVNIAYVLCLALAIAFMVFPESACLAASSPPGEEQALHHISYFNPLTFFGGPGPQYLLAAYGSAALLILRCVWAGKRSPLARESIGFVFGAVLTYSAVSILWTQYAIVTIWGCIIAALLAAGTGCQLCLLIMAAKQISRGGLRKNFGAEGIGIFGRERY